MNIKIKQHDITDCGAACLASVAAWYKLSLPVSRIRQWAGTDKKGTNAWGIIKAAEKMGLNAKGVKTPSEMIGEIPLPAIAHVITHGKLQHFVVIYRIGAHSIQIMDPATGSMKKMKQESFIEEWTGVLILISPSKDFKARNEKINNLKRFRYLLLPHKNTLMQAVAGAIFFTILGLSTSVYIQKITDHVLLNGNTNLLNLLSLIMLIILIVQIVIGTLQSIFILKTGQLIDGRLILGYYKHLLKLPQRFFDTMRTGEIISRINDAVKIRAFINDTLITLIVNGFIVIFAFSLMFIYNWKMAAIIFLIIPIFAAIYYITNQLNKKCERKIMEKAASLESQLVESLNAVKTIKQLGLEDFSQLKTETHFIDLLYSSYRSGLNSIFSTHSTGLLSRVFTIVLLWTGCQFVLRHEITPGELMSFYTLIGYFTGPVSELIGMNKSLQNATIAADRLFEIMDLEQESGEIQTDTKNVRKGDITFHNVSFGYGMQAEVLSNLNLSINCGEKTAIVGESGSGKTTIAALVQGLYTLNKGAIYIGHTNITYLNSYLRKRIGIVPQKTDLFAGTVLENIAVGEFNPDMNTVIAICKEIGILDFIESLPGGFKTYIGEQGTMLSGGQKQKLALARAFYRNPDILILDEATSSLDSTAELKVRQAVNRLKDKGKTIVAIDHRLESVMDSDKIIVLQNGKVMEEGSHSLLWRKKGFYYALWGKHRPDQKIPG